MSEHFLKKTKLQSDQPVSVDSVAVVEQFETLKAALTDGAGADVARVFAEPFINWGNDVSGITISWYCDVVGTAQKLSSVDPDLRTDVENRLSEVLGKAHALTGDPQNGRLIAGALSIASLDDVLVVGSQPVIVNWGMRSAGAAPSQATQNAHFAATLGKFLPLTAAPILYATNAIAAPPTGSGDAQQRVPVQPQTSSSTNPTEAVGQTASIAGGNAVPLGPVDEKVQTERSPHDDRRTPIWPVAVLAAVLAIMALWLLLPGTRLFPDDGRASARALDDNSIELVRRLNEDLAERERVLEAALEGAVCTPDGSLVLPDGRLPDGLLPPPTDAEVSPAETGRGDVIREGRSDATVPPDPSRISVPDAPRPEGIFAEDGTSEDGATPAPTEQNLVEVIEERTVLVISQNGEGLGFGTGFFIAPDLVATNHHVIENALAGGDVFVSNDALAELRPANIVTADGPFENTLADFAILRVPDVSSPYFSMSAESGSLKLQNVIAAGYPTDIMGTDFRFQQLLEGDPGAVPDLIFTDGVVNTEQAVSESRSLLVHSAPISKGNSGGPLVDTCGRVVGMNTFVREETFRNLNIAQSNPNFFEFLSTAGVTAETDANPCVPQVARVSVPREAPPEEAPVSPSETSVETDSTSAEDDATTPAESAPDAVDATAPETSEESGDISSEDAAPAEESETSPAETDDAFTAEGDAEVPTDAPEIAPEDDREVDPGEPLEPGVLDTRSAPPEALE